MSEEPVTVKGESMFDGAPRNPTMAQLTLIRSVPPPRDAEPAEVPPPRVPAHEVDLSALPDAGRRFAAEAEASGYEVQAVRSVGPLLDARGGWSREVEIVSVRCREGGRVVVAAAWEVTGTSEKSGKPLGTFDIAFAARADGGRHMTTSVKVALGWVQYGIEPHADEVPDMRAAAKYLARALGAKMIGVRLVDEDGHKTFICPATRDEVEAAQHLRDVHRLPGGSRDQHRHLHSVPRNHVHQRWPLGPPPEGA